MYLVQLVLVALSALIVAAKTPTRTIAARQDGSPPSPFVSTNPAGEFVVNGSRLNFIGTNAYWLPSLNTADDIDFTLGNMSAAGIKVVRVWAFNDVETIPVNGTWFQLIANGTTTINNGTNGLQKLDRVIQLAEKHNIFVLLSLTNNWNPRPLLDNITDTLASGGIQGRDVTLHTNNSLARNTLSNDYGGMDVYVREFANDTKNHDEFYLNSVIQTHFNNYVSTIVSRYVNHTSVFSWEVANDPRCNSSLSASTACNTQTITRFHANVTSHIKKIDPNHLVSSGNQGFFCADCPKLFFKPPPAPQVSAAPNLKRRARPITKTQLVAERRVIEKKVRKLQQSQRQNSTSGGIRIRGRWMSTETRRQVSEAQGVGSAFDGSQGVDSEDILAVPGMGFGTFQLFPDQNNYGPSDPTLPAFNNTVKIGIEWIQRHALLGKLLGKPVTLTGFGLVTQSNAPVFVPFNSTVAPFAPDSASDQATQPFGVTDQQRDDAYTQWLHAGIENGLQGMLQYQECVISWTQGNVTASEGTVIQPTVAGTGINPLVTGTGFTPNDGYGLQSVGTNDPQAVGVLTQAAQAIGPD